MPDILSDGTVSWIGGMDTSRSPADIGEIQYSKGSNVVIPSSLGGIRVRFGLHCSRLEFENETTKELYKTGSIQAEGWFKSNSKTYLICLVDGYVLKFSKFAANAFYVQNLNSNDRNLAHNTNGWVITIPNGCIINNGFDLPIYATSNEARRTKPDKNEIGIGQMGVYVQHRLFTVDQSGTRILASDFLNPIKFTLEDTNIFGFMCPDESEKIIAIARQKSMLGTAEGGNLIWSSTKSIYSADIRGTRSEWANLGSKVGKTTETVPGLAAASSNSFEAFNTNLYFRTKQFGIADLKQSEYQFVNLDSYGCQSVEASYYLDNDTEFMLNKCYTRACNKRLFTTVAPERNDKGFVFWNGILSFHPSTVYAEQGNIPRRFESVFTGVRPWGLTVIDIDDEEDKLFIHSFDKDGINRLYVMEEDSDYDIDFSGNIKEIEGFVETKAYTLHNPLLLKIPERRFYRLNLIERSVKIKLFSRPEIHGDWNEMSDLNHLVCRNKITDGLFVPIPHKGQTRPFVNLGMEEFGSCYEYGTKFLALQYRLEFKGPINLDSIVVIGSVTNHDLTVSQQATECTTLSYTYRPDYGYSIATI